MDIERDYSYGIIPFYREALGEYVFFIGRTQDQDGQQAFWKFPKGHKDSDDEDEVDAARRELREETALDLPEAAVIQSQPFSEEYFFERKSREGHGEVIVRKINTYFLAQVATSGSGVPEIQLEQKEFSDHRWVSFTEALTLLPENSRDMFSQAHDWLVRHRA